MKNNSFWIWRDTVISSFYIQDFLSVCFVLKEINTRLDLFIIASERSIVRNGIWLPRACFFLHGACLFKISIFYNKISVDLILNILGRPPSFFTKTSYFIWVFSAHRLKKTFTISPHLIFKWKIWFSFFVNRRWMKVNRRWMLIKYSRYLFQKYVN